MNLRSNITIHYHLNNLNGIISVSPIIVAKSIFAIRQMEILCCFMEAQGLRLALIIDSYSNVAFRPQIITHFYLN